MTDFPIDPHAPSLGFIVNPQTGTGAAIGGNTPLICSDERHAAKVAQLTAERDEARQHAAAIAAQRDRLRQRMNNLADRWDHALAVDKPYARTLRNEISVAPFDPEGAMAVQEYTERGRHLWAFRCWGTDTCDGWLGLGHATQTSALLERERHVAEAHDTPVVDWGKRAEAADSQHGDLTGARITPDDPAATPARPDRGVLAAIARIHADAIRQLHEQTAHRLDDHDARLLRGLDDELGKVLEQLGGQAEPTVDKPAGDDGPSIAECAANDRKWPLERGGE